MTVRFDPATNHFELFGLQPAFKLDSALLDAAFRALQAEVHPDKSAHLSDGQQRIAMQISTRVNEAYQTLKRPINRARYLLSLHGVDTQEECNTAMPVDFLMAQMERREAVEAADDLDALQRLETETKRDTRELEAQLAVKIDAEQAYSEAAGLIRKLRFMEKLAEEIHAAYDELDS